MIKVLMPSIVSLGKGEVESSILSCSTIISITYGSDSAFKSSLATT